MDIPADTCGPESTSLGCRHELTPVERLCIALKPPPFPGWLNHSEVENYKRVCSSWQTYEDICIHGRGTFRFGIGSPTTSPTTWIAPGIAFSACTILIVGTMIAYIWLKRIRSKYWIDRVHYHCYRNSHCQEEKSRERPTKVETYSVTMISTGKISNFVENGQHETNLDSEENVDSFPDTDVLSKSDSNNYISNSSELSSDVTPDGSPKHSKHALPNVVPYQDVIAYERTSKDVKSVPKSESDEPVQQTGRVYQVGYDNPAYDGNESLKEGRSPKKKNRLSRFFFGNKRDSVKL